jgi:hypothetical protein
MVLMKRISPCSIVLAMSFLLGAFVPATASAAWAPPVGTPQIITAYGVRCETGRHRGVDLAATAGVEVLAPQGGRVVFAGQVPADGGGTCGAVTIAFGGDLRVSLMPLAEVFVSEGGDVGQGECIGTLAASGDGSTAEPHLHVGLRQGDLYIDPTGFIEAVAAQADAMKDAPDSSPVDAGGESGTHGFAQEPLTVSAIKPQVSLAEAPAAGTALVAPSAGAAALPLPAADTYEPRAARVAAGSLPHNVPEEAGVPLSSQIVLERERGRAPGARVASAIAAGGGSAWPALLAGPAVVLVTGALGAIRRVADVRAW